MDIKRFSHVQHISSEIVGILDPNHDMFTALASNFPRRHAIRRTQNWNDENYKYQNRWSRRLRVAPLVVLFLMGIVFCYPDSLAVYQRRKAYAQTSAVANVYDSNPEDEYEEIVRKLSAMKVVLSNLRQCSKVCSIMTIRQLDTYDSKGYQQYFKCLE